LKKYKGGTPVSLARNSAVAEKRERAKIPSPQPPSFLPARAFGFQNSKSGFSSKKVRILTKRYRQFTEFGFLVECCLASRFSGKFQAVLNSVRLKAGFS